MRPQGFKAGRSFPLVGEESLSSLKMLAVQIAFKPCTFQDKDNFAICQTFNANHTTQYLNYFELLIGGDKHFSLIISLKGILIQICSGAGPDLKTGLITVNCQVCPVRGGGEATKANYLADFASKSNRCPPVRDMTVVIVVQDLYGRRQEEMQRIELESTAVLKGAGAVEAPLFPNFTVKCLVNFFSGIETDSLQVVIGEGFIRVDSLLLIGTFFCFIPGSCKLWQVLFTLQVFVLYFAHHFITAVKVHVIDRILRHAHWDDYVILRGEIET